MSRARQEKEISEAYIRYIKGIQEDKKLEALKPLQDITQGGVGYNVHYQALIVRFEDIQITRLKKKIAEFPRGSSNTDTISKLEAEVKHFEGKKEKALCALGKMVYEPVISIVNRLEEEERREGGDGDGDGDVAMTESIGGKKRRKSKGRRRYRKKRTKRRTRGKKRTKSRTKSRRKSRRRKRRR